MKAFVTGSTGLLGNNLVRLLIEQGHEVKALVRSREKGERLLGDTSAELVVGDLADVAAFAHELEGCDVLFHTAAYFREYYQPGEHWPLLEKLNVTATVELLEAAERYGLSKAIHTSSEGVLDKMPNGTPSNESSPYSRFAETNLYFKSKVLAEKAIYEFLETHSLPVVLILPGWMFGEGDAAPTSGGRMVLDYLEGKLPGLADGGSCAVDARDVAQAMITAVERGKSGERYVVAGVFTTLETIARTLEIVTNIPAPKMQIPYPVLLAYGWMSETIARLSGRDTLITVSGVKAMHEKKRVSSQRAIAELGVTFRPLADTLRDEVAWYRTNGYVKT